jgi:hypothetical protein
MGHHNTWSKKMRALSNKGVPILCSVAPYEGEVVKFSPRYPTDREPWVLAYVETPYRYNGRDVHPDLPPLEEDDDR